MNADSEESKEVDAALLRQCTCGGVAGCEPCASTCAIFIGGVERLKKEDIRFSDQLTQDVVMVVGQPFGAAEPNFLTEKEAAEKRPSLGFSRFAYTTDDVLKILANMGHDVTCGACMEIAFTGSTQAAHSCEVKVAEPIITTYGKEPTPHTINLAGYLRMNMQPLPNYFLTAVTNVLSDAWQQGKEAKPERKACSMCYGDWDNGRMSCMVCTRGFVEVPPKNPYVK